jgi:hypothetical protein
MQANLKTNQPVKVFHYIAEEGRYGKRPYWNVRVNGEVHQMWFATKRAAQAYLNRLAKEVRP